MNYSVSLRIFTLTGLKSLTSKIFLLYSMASGSSSQHQYFSSKQDILSQIRKEKQIYVERYKLKKGSQLKILSYNILAQTLLEKHPELYTRGDETYLNWNFRKQLLYRNIRDCNADILCLQEVEENVLDDLAMYLNIYGYKYLYKKRTSFNVDGCAIFYLETKLNLCAYTCLEFFKPNIPQLDRHNVGIVATFCINSTNKKLVIATTHILFNQKRHDIKLMQIQMLLTEIDRQSFISDNNYHPIIITGDFNFNETSPVYKFLTEGYLDLKLVNRRSLLPIDDHNSRYQLGSNDLLPSVLGITDQCSYVQEFAKRNQMNYLYLQNNKLIETGTNVVIENMFQSKEMSHNLQLSSVFESELGQVASTYHDEWTYVDFMFYNKTNKCPIENENKILLMSYLMLPTPQQCEEIIGCIPNEFCPSDHLPVVASFLLM